MEFVGELELDPYLDLGFFINRWFTNIAWILTQYKCCIMNFLELWIVSIFSEKSCIVLTAH